MYHALVAFCLRSKAALGPGPAGRFAFAILLRSRSDAQAWAFAWRAPSPRTTSHGRGITLALVRRDYPVSRLRAWQNNPRRDWVCQCREAGPSRDNMVRSL